MLRTSLTKDFSFDKNKLKNLMILSTPTMKRYLGIGVGSINFPFYGIKGTHYAPQIQKYYLLLHQLSFSAPD